MNAEPVSPKQAAAKPAKPRFSRWQVWSLLALGIVVVGTYGLLALTILHRRPAVEPAVVASTARDTLTLQRAYEQAQALAVGWQADVQWVSATTSWRLTGNDRLTLSRPAWSFTFYSPSAQQIQIVTVDMGGASASRQTGVSEAPRPVQADWNLDSDDLLLTFMAYGGETFIKSHAHINIHAQLKSPDGGSSIWYMTALDPVAQQSLTVGIDALSCQVVMQG